MVKVGFPVKIVFEDRAATARWDARASGSSDCGIALLCEAIACALRPFGIEKARLAGRNVTMRHLAIYLGHVIFGLSQKMIARLFGRDRTTVRYICARIEDLRDNRSLDRMLDAIEAAVCAFLRAYAPVRGGPRQ
jgi:hypothetical protein